MVGGYWVDLLLAILCRLGVAFVLFSTLGCEIGVMVFFFPLLLLLFLEGASMEVHRI